MHGVYLLALYVSAFVLAFLLVTFVLKLVDRHVGSRPIVKAYKPRGEVTSVTEDEHGIQAKGMLYVCSETVLDEWPTTLPGTDYGSMYRLPEESIPVTGSEHIDQFYDEGERVVIKPEDVLQDDARYEWVHVPNNGTYSIGEITEPIEFESPLPEAPDDELRHSQPTSIYSQMLLESYMARRISHETYQELRDKE